MNLLLSLKMLTFLLLVLLFIIRLQMQLFRLFLQRLFYSASFDKTMKVGAGFVCARRGGTTASFDVLNKFFQWEKEKFGLPEKEEHDE